MNAFWIQKSLELSAASYRDIQPYSPDTLTAMVSEDKEGTQLFLRLDGDTLWITFRGTDSPGEWRSNFTFSKMAVPYDNQDSEIRVHTGFLNGYKTSGVRDRVLKAITGNVHYIKICGHSRGAALAVLCAVDVQYNFPEADIEVAVFGCPRVGNKAFVKSYNKRVDKTVRIENGNDIVTKIPFKFMGYRHVGAKLHIGAIRLPFLFSRNDHGTDKYYSAFLTKKIDG